MSQYPELDCIMAEVREEIDRATQIYGPMNSPHEAYAVILEELDEFWDEVKREGDPSRMRKELTQVAAMAIRTIHDLA